MNIVVTGSLGYIGKPLTSHLMKNGHTVTLISSDANKTTSIEAMGAKAAIGSMDDVGFLTHILEGCDAAYCMLAPSGNFADPENTAEHIMESAGDIARKYVTAIEASGVKRIIYLSSIGAHLSQGNGLIQMHHRGEEIFSELLADVSLSILRPSGFYKNLLAFIPLIKHQGVIAANYGGNDSNILVSNLDIVYAVLEEIVSKESSRTIRYVASEESTCNHTAKVLGAAIGKPDMQWPTLTDEQQFNVYKNFMSESLARAFTEMNAAIHSGMLYEDYKRHRPILGKVKLEDFSPEFAAAYQQA